MPRGPSPGVVLITAIALFLWFMVWVSQQERPEDRLAVKPVTLPRWKRPSKQPIPTVAPGLQSGAPIAGHLGNETAKAELGRAAWKLFHTTMARFPDKPTQDESDALKSYIYLFARLYPCGDCAEHFQKLLKQYPPQTSSRSSAAAWACFVHNQVNERKGKPIFDCSNIGDWYDCGCADDEKEQMSSAGAKGEAIVRHDRVNIEMEEITDGG